MLRLPQMGPRSGRLPVFLEMVIDALGERLISFRGMEPPHNIGDDHAATLI